MSTLQKSATITAKGQITLPKAIRQVLDVGYGDKLCFKLHGSQVIVSKESALSHADPAIADFLKLLENDIKNGSNISTLPQDLKKAMVSAMNEEIDLDAEITGEVAL